jgi:hypothetical protein
MTSLSGLTLLEEREGEGRQAGKGDEVLLNEIQAKQVPNEMIRVIPSLTAPNYRRDRTCAAGHESRRLSQGPHQGYFGSDSR